MLTQVFANLNPLLLPVVVFVSVGDISCTDVCLLSEIVEPHKLHKNKTSANCKVSSAYLLTKTKYKHKEMDKDSI